MPRCDPLAVESHQRVDGQGGGDVGEGGVPLLNAGYQPGLQITISVSGLSLGVLISDAQ